MDIKNSKHLLQLLLVLIMCSITLKVKAKEVVEKATSFVVLNKERDSILLSKIKELKNKSKGSEKALVLKLGLQLIDESMEKEDYETTIETCLIVGEIFHKARDYEKTIDVYKKALNLIGKFLDTSYFDNYRNKGIRFLLRKDKILLKIGGNYQLKYITDNSRKYRDSALVYYNRVIDDVGGINNREGLLTLKAKAYSNLSGIYWRDSIYDKAKEFVNKSIEIHRRQNNKLSEAAALSNLANIFISQKEYEKAKQLYSRGLKLIENEKSIYAIEFKESLYENLGYAMYMLKDYKAYEIQDLSYEIKDSLRDVDVRRMIEQVNAEYNVDNVRQAEELKRIKIESEKEASQKNTWLVGAMGLITALLLLYIANYYKLRQQKLSLELSNTEFMQREKLDKLKAESQLKMLNATLDGKEEERKEIAETLHDNVSALLSSANLHLQASQKQFNGNTPVEIEKTQKIILEASQKVRDLSHTLVSSILLKFGLAYAIKDMANKYTNSMLSIHVDFNTINRYTQKLEIKIYNIIQELVNNIIKHSKASNACVLLKESGETLHITIRDNGCGFDASAYNTDDIGHVKSGIGLNQIRARVQIMKGTFKINSKLGKGTEMVIILPIKFRESFTRA
ncbi:tetratricopeptide repeat-containing sensor histidine kinase [Tenacibaculum maritimum]|uniref:tetratricopeptide repeat-containing sensor histidine kinase n=1 Tax=Tenacibaculum maritimum TaxID=107401 RepID=UPI00041FADA5|nr:tetratricopeptide repeat-containing sensor histidine kinase [Tenacibaculum maritimum]MCD9611679.1 tetratricopeptide repeat protein [Tenacibaculum maritimum]CAA0205777.1 Two-component system sensor histidine kinase [Tenacibaculum maritimum]CAA0212506.1 Two-component system sensor histidine kinase [Tenacibaculum maritimum]CAA0217289.1 Two-component system sensor histidine kinase [Tenacibaculum maritimum]CAA0224659.1 Two-component system sensor histidine kinase [Tenacibaculum maritimum]